MSLLGNIVRSNKKEAGGGAGITTADNALTVNPAGNVQWGATAAGANSPLLHATFINSGGFLTTMTGANNLNRILAITNTDANGLGLTVTAVGEAIRGTSTNNFAVVGVSTNSAAGSFVSINNVGVIAETRTATLINPALLAKKDVVSANTDERVFEIQRLVSGGNGANNIGCHINWALDTTVGQENILQIGVTLPNATSATKISNFYIDGVDGVTVNRTLLLKGDGSCSMGDLGGINNGTLLQIDDAAQSVIVKGGASDYLFIDIAGGGYKLGDISAAANGGQVFIDDALNQFSYSIGGNAYLLLSKADDEYWIGDFNGTNNTSYIKIDDDTADQSILLIALNGIQTTQPSATGAGKWLLGKRIAAAVAFDATQYIEVMIDGTLRKLAMAV